MISLFASEAIVASGAIILLMISVFQRRASMTAIAWLAIMILLVALFSQLRIWDSPRTLLFSDLFITDRFTILTKGLVLAASALSILMSISYAQREGFARFEYPILMLFSTLGMIMMISAHDAMSLYMSLELQSLSLYVIAAIRRDSLRSSEAALKYFVLGAVASSLLLYGLSWVYGFTGSTRFEAIAAAIAQQEPVAVELVVGLTFILGGLIFKIAAVPFHMWIPDTYQGVPIPVTAFFASAPKIAAMAILLRVMLEPFSSLFSQWQAIMITVSALSMLVGSLAAIAQSDLKRLLAYSSIGHVGFMLAAFAAGNEEGVEAVIFYLFIYLLMTLGSFACLINLRREGIHVENVHDLAGLGRSQPSIALAMTVFMFSMAGIPPLAGFFGKFFVFKATVEAGLTELAILGVLTSVIAAFYYLRIIKWIYFDNIESNFDKIKDHGLTLVITATALLIVGFPLIMDSVLSQSEAAVQSLFQL